MEKHYSCERERQNIVGWQRLLKFKECFYCCTPSDDNTSRWVTERWKFRIPTGSCSNGGIPFFRVVRRRFETIHAALSPVRAERLWNAHRCTGARACMLDVGQIVTWFTTVALVTRTDTSSYGGGLALFTLDKITNFQSEWEHDPLI